MSTDMDWPNLGTAAIRRAVELTEERDRARSIAVALEQQVARIRTYATTLDNTATRRGHYAGAELHRIAVDLRDLTGEAS